MPTRGKLINKVKDCFVTRFGSEPDLTVAAPGRANLIGEHTDYNDGHVLPVAIDKYIVAAASNQPGDAFRIFAEDFDEAFEFCAGDIPDDRPLWASYIVGVIAELLRAGFIISGKQILIHGNIPVAAGLSSSAALEISTATAIKN